MEDWKGLRKAYLASEESLGKLARDFGISPGSAYRRCAAEGWAKLRKGKEEKDPLLAAADALLCRVRTVLEGEEEMDIKSMRDLAAVLKEIRGMQGTEKEDTGISGTLCREVMDYSEEASGDFSPQ